MKKNKSSKYNDKKTSTIATSTNKKSIDRRISAYAKHNRSAVDGALNRAV